jgi:hypothetical protein
MLQNYEPERYIEELTETDIYSAIRYLEPETQGSEEPDDRGNVALAIILLIFVLGLLAFIRFH